MRVAANASSRAGVHNPADSRPRLRVNRIGFASVGFVSHSSSANTPERFGTLWKIEVAPVESSVSRVSGRCKRLYAHSPRFRWLRFAFFASRTIGTFLSTASIPHSPPSIVWLRFEFVEFWSTAVNGGQPPVVYLSPYYWRCCAIRAEFAQHAQSNSWRRPKINF